jgi:Zn ribbon nucleic-acid-binding protein
MMSTFVCPQCGQKNEYDPWTEQAQCRHCGFSPPEGQEMLAYLRQQEEAAEEQPREPRATERTRLTRFLPTDGRSFLSGLAWGLFVFAAIMLLGSALGLPGDAVRCLGLLLPFLATFAIWRWQAWRETGE